MKRRRSTSIREFYETGSETKFRRGPDKQLYTPWILSIIEDMLDVIKNELSPVERVMLALTCKEGLVRLKRNVDMLHGHRLFQATMLLEDRALFKYLFEERLFYSMKKGVGYKPEEFSSKYVEQLSHITGMALELETKDAMRFLKYALRTDVLQNPLCRCPSSVCEDTCVDFEGHRCYDGFNHHCNPSLPELLPKAFELGYYPTTTDLVDYVHFKTYIFSSSHQYMPDIVFQFQRHNIMKRNLKVFCYVVFLGNYNHRLNYETFRALESFRPHTTTSKGPEDKHLIELYSSFNALCLKDPLFREHYEFMMEQNCPLRYYLCHVRNDTNTMVREEMLPHELVAFALRYEKHSLLAEIINHYNITAYDALIMSNIVKVYYQDYFGTWNELGWNNFMSQCVTYDSTKRTLECVH